MVCLPATLSLVRASVPDSFSFIFDNKKQKEYSGSFLVLFNGGVPLKKSFLFLGHGGSTRVII